MVSYVSKIDILFSEQNAECKRCVLPILLCCFR